MQLEILKREKQSKSEIKKIRREGNIPGVIYNTSKENENIFINGREFDAILRGIKEDRLSTTIFTSKRYLHGNRPT